MNLEKLRALPLRTLLIVLVKPDPDLAMVFVATEDEQSKLTGLVLYGVRASAEFVPFRIQENITLEIFHPTLTLTETKRGSSYTLHLEPLECPLTVIQKSSGYVCTFPFKDAGKIGVISHVLIDGDWVSNTMWFSLLGSFRVAKDAVPVELEEQIQCSEAFIANVISVFHKK